MVIIYKNAAAEKQFSPKYKKAWRYPEQVKKRLLAVETFIRNAPTLSDIAYYPTYNFHPLRGDLKGQWSIRLGYTGYRVTLFPCDAQGIPIKDGDIIAQCKLIKIVMITEVSNHYE